MPFQLFVCGKPFTQDAKGLGSFVCTPMLIPCRYSHGFFKNADEFLQNVEKPLSIVC